MNNALQFHITPGRFEQRIGSLASLVAENIEAIRRSFASDTECTIAMPHTENIAVLAFEESILMTLNEDLARMRSLLSPEHALRALADEASTVQERVAHHQSVFDTINEQEPVLSDPQYCEKYENWDQKLQKHKKKLDAAHTLLAWVQWQQSRADNDPVVGHLKAEERIAIELEFNRVMSDLLSVYADLQHILQRGESAVSETFNTWAEVDDPMGRAAKDALKILMDAEISARVPRRTPPSVTSRRIRSENGDQRFHLSADRELNILKNYVSACDLYDKCRNVLITTLDDCAKKMRSERKFTLPEAQKAVQENLNHMMRACNTVFVRQLNEQGTPLIPSKEQFIRYLSEYVHHQSMQISTGEDPFSVMAMHLSMTLLRFHWLDFQSALCFCHRSVGTAYEKVFDELSSLNPDDRIVACQCVLSRFPTAKNTLRQIAHHERIENAIADFLDRIGSYPFHTKAVSERAITLDLLHHTV